MGCLKVLFRLFFVLSYIALIIITIVLIVFTLAKVKENTELISYNINLNDELSRKSQETQRLNSHLQETQQKLRTLDSESHQFSKEGYGEITGKISGQILGSDIASQYQFVCAQNIKNTNLQHCLNVSSITQNYSIIVPAGTYRVFAKATDNNQIVLNDYAGIYSQYIKCLSEKPQNECDETQLQSEAVVEITAGSKIEGVNPIDWQKVGQ